MAKSSIELTKISDATRTAQITSQNREDRFFFGIGAPKTSHQGDSLDTNQLVTNSVTGLTGDEKIKRLRILVERKAYNSYGSQLLAKSRHFHQEGN